MAGIGEEASLPSPSLLVLPAWTKAKRGMNSPNTFTTIVVGMLISNNYKPGYNYIFGTPSRTFFIF